ncbi:hypothetical protein [Gorillibacterium sp. CAU 1737]|uniref:WD40/YVTN/BNR-like repeat-containing protein n=1 Tax=Gorillibacterium sp. CAU 1737 TaxID=3140362 RepID=UPI003261A77B
MREEKPDWYTSVSPEPFSRPMFTEQLSRQIKERIATPRRTFRQKAFLPLLFTAAMGFVVLFAWLGPSLFDSDRAELADTEFTGTVESLTGQAALVHVRSALAGGISDLEQVRHLMGENYLVVTQLVFTDKNDQGYGTSYIPALDGTYRYDFGIVKSYSPEKPTSSQWYDREGLLSGKMSGSLLVTVQAGELASIRLAYAGPAVAGVRFEDYPVPSIVLNDTTDVPSGEIETDPLLDAVFSIEPGKKVDAAHFPDSLRQIHMIDEKRGWAAGIGLWTTEDGGESWTKRLPNQKQLMVTILTEKSIVFFDADRALYVDRNPGYESRMPTLMVYRTEDRGVNWMKEDLPIDEDWERTAEAQLTFLNEQQGWILLSGKGEEIGKRQLYLTRDGGVSWKRLDHTGKKEGTLQGIEGTATGLVFRTEQEGYVTFSGSTDAPMLYRTEDGGKTWSRYSGLAGTEETGTYLPPQFFGEDRMRGVLALSQADGTRWLHTEDGGKTWIGDFSSILLDPSQPKWVQFVDTQAGFALDRQHQLQRTDDGGKTWMPLGITLVGESMSLHFISPEMGWISADNKLSSTKHGGYAWTPFSR